MLLLTAIASLSIANTHAGMMDVPLTPEEKALYDKGLFMETYEPSKHSGHEIGTINAKGESHQTLIFIFGMEDAQPAQAEGKNMAQMRYTPSMAQQFLFAEAWDKYHDRFFTRAYVQEGMDAYNKERRSR